MTTPTADQWVLITGASAGIGEAFARRFASDGRNLVLTARSHDKLERLAAELQAKYKVQTKVVVADLSQCGAVEKIFEATKELRIEGLVNNAGFGQRGMFADVAVETYTAMVQVMVTAVVELSHHYLTGMLDRKSGFIINVSSMASFIPLPYASIYSASKAFVTFFSEALWMETRGRGIQIVNLCPGVTKTDFGTKAGHQNFYDDPLAEPVEAVVETAMKALAKGRLTVVSGRFNWWTGQIVRRVPKWILLRALPWIQRQRRG